MTIGFDTMVAAHLLDEQQPRSLLDQATLHLGVDDWGKGQQRFGEDLGDPAALLAAGRLSPLWGSDGLLTYCARDTGYAHLLYERQRLELRAEQALAGLARYLVFPGLDAYRRVEAVGMPVLWDRVDERERATKARIVKLADELREDHVPAPLLERWRTRLGKRWDPVGIFENDGFLVEWLFGAEGLGLKPTGRTSGGRPQVDARALRAQVNYHPAAAMLAELNVQQRSAQFFAQWREWRGDDDRLHPYYSFTGTVTGRRSCANPNLQQVPRLPYMRSCFGARPGWLFLEVDYSQIEVRIMAWLAEDEAMLDVFRRGGDVYVYVASNLSGISEAEVTRDLRQRAKAVVLGFLYGMGVRKFRQYARDQYGVDFAEVEGARWRDAFFRLFPGVVRFHEQQRLRARANFRVESPIGRRRNLLDVLSFDEYTRGKAERQAINSPDQGLGGDLVLAVIQRLVNMLPPDEAVVCGDVHDAVLVEVRADSWRRWARMILEEMERQPLLVERFRLAPPVRLKAEGKIGRAWNDVDADGRSAVVDFSLETVDTVELAA